MKNRILICLTGMILILCMVAPAMAVEVAQGKCVKLDSANKTVTIEEYDTDFTKPHIYGKPTGKESTFNIATAMIGADPNPGDILRIAYEEKGGQKIAFKVMNVTRQDIMRK
jgi:hypothetical protein